MTLVEPEKREVFSEAPRSRMSAKDHNAAPKKQMTAARYQCEELVAVVPSNCQTSIFYGLLWFKKIWRGSMHAHSLHHILSWSGRPFWLSFLKSNFGRYEWGSFRQLPFCLDSCCNPWGFQSASNQNVGRNLLKQLCYSSIVLDGSCYKCVVPVFDSQIERRFTRLIGLSHKTSSCESPAR